MKLEAVIGLEIHLQLKTKSKMFCSCPAIAGETEPNSAVCPICLGHPGTLPVLNRAALEQAIRLAAALNFRINPESKFDRKNYFYPDLPKGYQISQFQEPLASDGSLSLDLDGHERAIGLERLHLEEDAGKILHRGATSQVDFNRSGTPLAEIVTRPDFRTPQEARSFLQELRLIARYTETSYADMEKGNLRCDANISLRPVGEATLYPKTEIKNLNSFKSVERALIFEIKRQSQLWQVGKAPRTQTTRGWDDDKLVTVEQRSKEESNDYRYFPEPDLPPLRLETEIIEPLVRQLPELPEAKRRRFMSEYELPRSDASILCADQAGANFFEAVVSELRSWLADLEEVGEGSDEEIWLANRRRLCRLAYSWLTSELLKHLNADGKSISELELTPENFAEFIGMVYEAKINSSAAQTILERLYHQGGDPHHIAETENLFQVDNEGDLQAIVDEVISQQADQAEEYRRGKTVLLKYFVGLAMKASGGRAHPQTLEKLLKRRLDS